MKPKTYRRVTRGLFCFLFLMFFLLYLLLRNGMGIGSNGGWGGGELTMLSEYESVHGKWRGISEPTPAIKSWLRHELGQ